MTISPGSTIGIIGGGQLGRMLAIAAAQLGYKCHIYAPDETPPAVEVAADFTRGEYHDEQKLARFAARVDVATYEFENVGAGPLTAITRHAALHPSRRVLEIAQDRLAEKNFVIEQEGRPAPFAPVDTLAELEEALTELGAPAILKTRRFGYDGKGQVRIDRPEAAGAAWEAVRETPCVLERLVPFDAEFSILLCRSATGETKVWPTPENEHRQGILRSSSVPADPRFLAAIGEAERLSLKMAEALDHVGMLALEFFAVGKSAIFNEFAPRVHNSGHWTIEGSVTSQFENHVRAICGLPLGSTDLTASRVEMHNLIGDDVDKWREILADPTAHLHLYGKRNARPGRKMGHVTRLVAAPIAAA